MIIYVKGDLTLIRIQLRLCDDILHVFIYSMAFHQGQVPQQTPVYA